MSIFSKNNVFGKKQILETTELYTIIGEEDLINDNGLPTKNIEDDKVYAKKIVRTDASTKYLIRLDYSAKLFNPLSIYDKTEKRPFVEFLDSVCRSNKKFKEVNVKVFDLYMKFLSTKNISWLYNAEREIL
jgi:hypothetical protein